MKNGDGKGKKDRTSKHIGKDEELGKNQKWVEEPFSAFSQGTAEPYSNGGGRK